MDADERLTALKKAYADIILNTAKEAAARIMVSERKALQFQHELCVAKEEALQMLIRLKQMMDSKISEAEMISLSQQRKVEELEAQLQEAEDIVKDLREELREVQGELERVTNNKLHHLNECDTAQEETLKNRLNASQSIIFPPPEPRHESIAVSNMKNATLNQRNEGTKCCSANDSHMGNLYVGNHDLPSIIMRSKEPELYRNGCTQRIRAFERNLLDGELSLSGQIDDVKNETSVREDEEDKRKREEFELDKRINNSFRRKKRAISYRKKGTPSCKYLLDQTMKRDQASDISCSETHPNLINNNAQSGEDPSEMAPRLSSGTTERGTRSGCAEVKGSEEEFVKAYSDQNTTNKDMALIDELVLMRQEKGSAGSSVVPVCRIDLEKVDVPLVNSESEKMKNETSVREDEEDKREREELELNKRIEQINNSFRRKKRAISYRKKRTPSCKYLLDQTMKKDQASDISCSETHPNLINNNAQSGEDPSEMAPRLSSDTTERGTRSGCAEVKESEEEFVKASSDPNTTNKDMALIDELVLMRQEKGSAGSSGVPVCRIDLEKVDVPLVNSESKPSDTTIGISSQPVNDRIIKYTFQRKRKKEPLSGSDGNASLGKSTLKRKSEEKQNGSLGPQKSSLITESSRDSRRLAQVARQLISLSEKKWWQ